MAEELESRDQDPLRGTGSILSWYDSTRPMFIDLVGDYAGKELFLVEGDSLLRECFEDERIDFDCEFGSSTCDYGGLFHTQEHTKLRKYIHIVGCSLLNHECHCGSSDLFIFVIVTCLRCHVFL
jgi:hypothetical protein